jgi:hypothetical protein
MGHHQQCTIAQAMEQLSTQLRNDQQHEGPTKEQHEGISNQEQLKK